MNLQTKVRQPEWRATPGTLIEWSKVAVTWFSLAYDVVSSVKWAVATTPYNHLGPRIDPIYEKIKAAQKSVSLVIANPRDDPSVKALGDCLREHLQSLQNDALNAWRQRFNEWTPSSRQLYSYMRNPFPKATILANEAGRWLTEPGQQYNELQSFWVPIESWPPDYTREHALAKVTLASLLL